MYKKYQNNYYKIPQYFIFLIKILIKFFHSLNYFSTDLILSIRIERNQIKKINFIILC